MKKIILLMFAALTVSFAQHSVVGVSVKITEESGESINANVKLIGNNNKVEKTKITNGNFNFSPLSGYTYKVFIPNYIMENGSKEIVLPESTTYQDIEKQLKCRKLKEGDLLFSEALFEKNLIKLEANAEQKLRNFKDFLDNQPNLVFNLVISTADCNFKPIKKKETVTEGKKKKTITKTITVEEQAKALIAERKAFLTSALQAIGMRIASFNVIEDTSVAKAAAPAKKAKGKKDAATSHSAEIANVKFSITKIRS